MAIFTLNNAAKLLATSTVNPFVSSNKAVVRDLEWILACCQGAGYSSRIMRYALDNVTAAQRAGHGSFYCATQSRMDLITEERPVQIKWHAGKRPLPYSNDHLIPLRQQYLQMTRMRVNCIEQIYDCIVRWNWMIAVAADEDRRLTRDTMPDDWDGEDIFARPRAIGITHVHLFPGRLVSGYWNMISE